MKTSALRRALAIALVAAAVLGSSHPQEPCPDRGSQRVPVSWTAGPALGCAGAPAEPAWRLYTPTHRQVVARRGHYLGVAHEHPQLVLRYECTGYWLQPLRLTRVAAWGVVLDVEELSCSAPVPLPPSTATDR